MPFLLKAGLAVDHDLLMRVIPFIRVRLTTLDDVVDMAGFFFRDDVRPIPEELLSKGLTQTQALDVTRRSLAVLQSVLAHRMSLKPSMRYLEQPEKYALKQFQTFVRDHVDGGGL